MLPRARCTRAWCPRLRTGSDRVPSAAGKKSQGLLGRAMGQGKNGPGLEAHLLYIDQPVGNAASDMRGLHSRTVEHDRVTTALAFLQGHIEACAALELVASTTAQKQVIARTAKHDVVARIAIDLAVAALATQGVVASAAVIMSSSGQSRMYCERHRHRPYLGHRHRRCERHPRWPRIPRCPAAI